MKNWWLGLNAREQQLVAIMSIFVTIFLFIQLVWQPLNESLVKAEKKLQQQQSLLTWVDENTSRYKTAIKSSGNNNSGSISSLVNRSAKQHNIVITRVQPQGNDLQVWVEDMPFFLLLTWLADLSEKQGLQVNAIDLLQTDVQGVVKIRRLQLGKN